MKNYRELCSLLEIKTKQGKSKQLQLMDIERYIEYKKDKYKFIILKKYDTPKEKENYTDVFGELMQLLITDYLIESGKRVVTITRNRLLVYIHMFNENYSFCSVRVPELSKYTKIDEQTIYDFFNTSGSSFRKAFETALKNLRKKSLIVYETVMCVCTKGNDYREATEEEREEIIKLEISIAKKLGFEDASKVRVSSKWNIFKNEIKKELSKMDLRFHYMSYRITVNRKYIEESHNNLLHKTLDEIERENKKEELNYTVIQRLLDNAKKRKNKGFLNGKMAKIRSKNNYVSDIEKLTDILIDSEARWIGNELEKISEFHFNDELDDLFS